MREVVEEFLKDQSEEKRLELINNINENLPNLFNSFRSSIRAYLKNPSKNRDSFFEVINKLHEDLVIYICNDNDNYNEINLSDFEIIFSAIVVTTHPPWRTGPDACKRHPFA